MPPNTAAASSSFGAGWSSQHWPNTNSDKDEYFCRQYSDGLVTPVAPEDWTLPLPTAFSVCTPWHPRRGEPLRPPRTSPQMTFDYAEPRRTQPDSKFYAWPEACSTQKRSHSHQREIPYCVEQPANGFGDSPASGSRASLLGMAAAWGSLCAGCSRQMLPGTGSKNNTYALSQSSCEHVMALSPAGVDCVRHSSAEPFVSRSHASTPPHTWTSKQFASAGSASHRGGRCKPCAFVHQGRCAYGTLCEFCHLCSPGEKKRRTREKIKRVKEAYRRRKGSASASPVLRPVNSELAAL